MFTRSFYICFIIIIAIATSSCFTRHVKDIPPAVGNNLSQFLLYDSDMAGYQLTSQEMRFWELPLPKYKNDTAVPGIHQVWRSSQGKDLAVYYGRFGSTESALDASAPFILSKQAKTIRSGSFRWKNSEDKAWILSVDGKETTVFIQGKFVVVVESPVPSLQDRADLEETLLKVLGKIYLSQGEAPSVEFWNGRSRVRMNEPVVIKLPAHDSDTSGWVKYAETEYGAKLYYDKNGMAKPGKDIVLLWKRSETEAHRSIDRTKTQLDLRTLYAEIDCAIARERILIIKDLLANGNIDTTYYDNNHSNNMKWTADGVALYKAVCPGRETSPAQSPECSSSGKEDDALTHDAGGLRPKFSTKEQLVSSFIEALNKNDEEKLRQTIHPASLREITKENSIFYEDLFAGELGYLIPEDVSITYSKVEDPDSFLLEPRASEYCFPIKPTDKFELNFLVTKATGRIVTKYIKETTSGWFILLPKPKEAHLKNLRARKIKLREYEKRAEELVQSMDKAVYSKMVEYLKQEKVEEAIEAFQRQPISDGDKGLSFLVVESVMKKEDIKIRGISPQ